ncbi:MAG: DNA-processing protein DprA [Candidatus Omnitrophica bacterium]|nr:DNA-processing protein DprA [Candidatus Omnitrophota bacterium]
MTDIERFLILNMIEDLGSIRTQALIERFGSPEEIFKARQKDLEQVEGIGPKIAPKIWHGIREIDVSNEMKLIREHKIKIMTILDKDYPLNLKNIYDPPVVLYVKGGIIPEDDLAIAIVGSRRASFYGMKTAERLGFELAARGITVVSGLARGIDSSSHKGALKAKGRTLAILGSGLINIYPEEHRSLAEEISENGAVISEFPMLTIPDKGNFPKRNRVVNGLSKGVVVVEAAQRSGALITADCALQEGREVFAVPGKIDSSTSKGTNKLIKQGAKLAETAEDILEELNLFHRVGGPEVHLRGGTGQTGIYNNKEYLSPRLDKCESLVYNLLTSEPQHIDELSVVLKLRVSEVSGILLNLEMKKLARQLPGKNFVKDTD